MGQLAKLHFTRFLLDASNHGKAILCVDDEGTGLSIRKMILESQGYRVFTAENGPDALALFASEAIDLVILDYSMPGMHGGVVAEKMKKLRPAVPILMLSAYVDLPGETLALVDLSITKGEPIQVLFGAVADLLSDDQSGQARATSVA
ncbi:MAG: response regulator [Terriglobales bacterium]